MATFLMEHLTQLPEGEKLLFLAVAAPAIYCILLLAGKSLRRRSQVRLGLMYHFFAVSVALYLPLLALNYPAQTAFESALRQVSGHHPVTLAHAPAVAPGAQPPAGPNDGGDGDPFQNALGAAVALFGSLFVIALLNRYLWEVYFEQKRRITVPQLLREVLALLIFGTAVLLILGVDYHVKVPGLLAGSGIAAVILGLGMQDLLGNIFAGCGLHFGRPFRVGDWLIIDTRHLEVMEINWRSTRLRDNDNNYVDIPNSVIAKQPVMNLYYPTRLHAMRLAVGIDYAVPPNRLKEVFRRAAGSVEGVLADPAPRVYLREFAESSIIYELKFWAEDHTQYNEMQDAIRTNLWYELKRENIRIPFPTRTVQMETPKQYSAEELHTAVRAAIRRQPLFQAMGEDEIDALARGAKLAHFGRAEHIIRQGRPGASMFILLHGEVDVIVQTGGQSRQVARLHAGSCFGEMSLLTGENRIATVQAAQDCEVIEIGKQVMARLLAKDPALLQSLSEMLTRRKTESNSLIAGMVEEPDEDPPPADPYARLRAKISAFFSL